MLQINAKVLTYDGNSVETGTVVSPSLNTALMTPNKDGIHVNTPVSLLFYMSLQTQNEGYKNIVPIIDTASKKRIDMITLQLTIEEASNPTKQVIESYIKTYLETIYGAGNVVII